MEIDLCLLSVEGCKSPKRPALCNFFNTTGRKSVISVVTASFCPWLKSFFLTFWYFSFRFDLSGAFLSVLLEGFAVGLLNAVVGVHVDEGFGFLLLGAFNHKLDFLFLFRQLKWKNSSLI